jgi:hypothetical protein
LKKKLKIQAEKVVQSIFYEPVEKDIISLKSASSKLKSLFKKWS